MIDYKKLLNKPVFNYEKFHNSTKIKNIGPIDDPQKWPIAWSTVFFKVYPRLDQIVLPSPEKLPNKLVDCLYQRKSSREFSDKPLTIEEISSLLFYSAGEKKSGARPQGNRFYPSPGARYPLEVYLISLNSELPGGIYHYNVRKHELEILLQSQVDIKEYFNQDWINKAGIILLITGVFERNTMKYGERGYRHVLTENGHMGQNVYLISAALNLSCCGIGGYTDDKINKALDIDGIKESLISVLVIGKIK